MGKSATGAGKKKLPAAPLAKKGAKKKVHKHPLFEKTPKNFRIGGDIQPKRDLTRYVKWPKCVRLQRMKRIMYLRMRIPPAVNQFNCAIDKNQAAQVIRLFKKYQPETRQQKKARLMEIAQQKKDGVEDKSKKPMHMKFGVNHVTTLIEEKKAQLVVIAHDVDPLELVVWMPTLCRKKEIPYCIIKSKSRLGQLVHQKTASCVCLTGVKKEDQQELQTLVKNFTAQFNDNTEIRRKWGGGIMGQKSQHKTAMREKALAAEHAKKLGLQLA